MGAAVGKVLRTDWPSLADAGKPSGKRAAGKVARDANAERQRKALAGTMLRRDVKKDAVKPTPVADAPATYSAGGTGDGGEVATPSPLQTPDTISKAIELYEWCMCLEIPNGLEVVP